MGEPGRIMALREVVLKRKEEFPESTIKSELKKLRKQTAAVNIGGKTRIVRMIKESDAHIQMDIKYRKTVVRKEDIPNLLKLLSSAKYSGEDVNNDSSSRSYVKQHTDKLLYFRSELHGKSFYFNVGHFQDVRPGGSRREYLYLYALSAESKKKKSKQVP